MLPPPKIWDQNARKTAHAEPFQGEPFENPGMYLIALRTHAKRGRSMLGKVVQTVANALPKPGRFERQEIP